MRDKIKVLRIIARLNIGGPAIHTILLTHYLNNTFETKLVVGTISEGEENMDYLLERYNVQPLYLTTLKRELSFIGDVKSMFSIYKLVQELQPDIVHTHTAKAGAVGRSAVILYNLLHLRFGKRKVKLIHTFHGHVFDGYFNKAVTHVFIWIERLMAVFTDRIIAVSDNLKNELTNKYRIASDSKIKIIYNGYELGPFLKINDADSKTVNRLPNNLPNSNPVILNESKWNEESHKFSKVHFLDSSASPKNDIVKQPENITGARSMETAITIVGRLVPIKGHKFLIQAFSMLKFPSRLVIVGDGILKEELVQLAEKLGIRQKVDFLGYKRDVIPVYRETDVVVLSSLNEGAPVAVIEALASAKPVIATDVGGVRDLLGKKVHSITARIFLCERGLLVPAGDAESLSTAINYLVNNPEIGYEMASKGRAFVSKSFTVERLIKDIKILYAEVLE